ncbi:MAG TPA: hypothetical protein VFV89_14075 [Nocardioides sp.]|uniref:hypothetical protein n=1 Tax=Nocardioides sp. TaxID=35761 RepID=UPI002E3673B0|nr:hypothetical protein [Nocardioides sp.]HEX5088932.1 hypothetical protein [Nocardioides sp.]
MTSELDTLRSVADRVQPPSFEALEEVARRRTRLAAAAIAVGCVLSVLVVMGGIAVVGAGDDHSAPPVLNPTPTPTPVLPTPTPSPIPTPTHRSETSMTPQEIISADDAELQIAAVSADDPDFRISVWMAECIWCPKEGEDSRFPHPYFATAAITADGYATATLRRAPWEDCVTSVPCGSHPVHMESVGPGLLLVVDRSNGYEWLVRDDGTITALERDFDEVAPATPRLWFQCLAVTGHSSGGAPEPDDARMAWCALDPAADTVHVWGRPWDGSQFSGEDEPSAASPALGLPWGVRWVDGLLAWWEVDGTRHYHDLGPATVGGVVDNAPPGVMSYWAWQQGSQAIRVFTSSDRGVTWQTTQLDIRFRPGIYTFDLYWTPSGALIGRQTGDFSPDGSDDGGEGVRIWRADFVDGGAFEITHQGRGGLDPAWYEHPFGFRGDQIWANWLWSDDDGRTWQEVTTWR